MEELLTDEQIVEAADRRYNNSFPNGGTHSHEEDLFATAYFMGFVDSAKWVRQQIMEKLKVMNLLN